MSIPGITSAIAGVGGGVWIKKKKKKEKDKWMLGHC